MAHEITATDNMVYAGQVPWHGLGIALPQEVTAKEALEKAGLSWLAVPSPVYIDSFNNEGEVDELVGHKAIIRSDTGDVLGLVSDEYVPLQNELVAEMADALAGEGHAWIHTAGSLKGGTIVWYLLKLPGEIKVKGDKSAIEPYCLLSNAHDGTRAMRIKPTSVRVVCANTHEMAMRRGADGFWIRHTGGAEDRFQVAKEGIASALEWHDRFGKLASAMNSQKYTEAQMRELAIRVAGESALKKHLTDVAKTKEENAHGPVSLADIAAATISQNIPDDIFPKQVLQRIETVQGLFARAEAGTKGKSAWDAYNAVTDYLDHRTARKGDEEEAREARAHRAWFGADVLAKRSALEMVLEQTGMQTQAKALLQ